MIPIGKADVRLAGSSAMSGRLDEQQAVAAIVLWNCGHFDTFDIGKVRGVGEDAVCRTLHAARALKRAGALEAAE